MFVSLNEKWQKNLLLFIYTYSKSGDLYFAQMECFLEMPMLCLKVPMFFPFFPTWPLFCPHFLLNSLQAPFMFRNPGHLNHSPYFGDACATDLIFYNSWRLPIRGCFWNYQAAAGCKSFGNIKGERCEG